MMAHHFGNICTVLGKMTVADEFGIKILFGGLTETPYRSISVVG
jgi:hypothetical protein